MIEIGINPVAFTIGAMSIRWYGIMIALGVIWLVVWMMWQARKGARITYDTAFTAALVGVPSGIIISRLLHVVDNIVVAKLHPELALAGYVIDYTQHPLQIIGGEGLTAYGAILGAALGIWVYSRLAKLEFGYLADMIAPAVMIAQAVIGRIGCTINGCCYGSPTSLPWGVTWTHPDSLAWPKIAFHPTQVYEIIYGLIAFGVLLKLRGRLKPDGSLFLIYLSLYAVWRLGIDFLRDGNPFLFGLDQAQIISIIVLAIAIPLLALRTRWVKAEEQVTESVSESEEE
jgi:phosphatidylglycerol:prolipoprotein diacylglycerol transferase